MKESTLMKLQEVLLKSWSKDSSSKWSKGNPSKGQCGVTALVVNDLLGGKINKTLLDEGWHFYNVINGVRYDFTVSQFNEDIGYIDIPSNREEAYLDTNKKQYDSLMQSVKMHLYERSKVVAIEQTKLG